MRAAPVPDPRAPSGDVALAGEVANRPIPRQGATSIRAVRSWSTCAGRSAPVLHEIVAGHLVRCHRAEELTLTGTADEPGERR
jgi:hypothetical protein